jgi:hypothetical protein
MFYWRRVLLFQFEAISRFVVFLVVLIGFFKDPFSIGKIIFLKDK